MNNLIQHELALREALSCHAGHLILQASTAYMVTLSAETNANPDWIKGIGMLIHYLNETNQRLERLNSQS